MYSIIDKLERCIYVTGITLSQAMNFCHKYNNLIGDNVYTYCPDDMADGVVEDLRSYW
mgnify:CR=1 FL=1